MTLAVCLKCGSIKHAGAFLPCEHCRHKIAGSDVGKALVLTDHHFTAEVLQEISEMIKGGEDVFEMPELIRMAEHYQQMHERMADPEYRRKVIEQAEREKMEASD